MGTPSFALNAGNSVVQILSKFTFCLGIVDGFDRKAEALGRASTNHVGTAAGIRIELDAMAGLRCRIDEDPICDKAGR